MRPITRREQTLTREDVARRSVRQQWQSAVVLAGALAVASFAPHPVVLPVTSVILVASGCLLAAYAWLCAERRDPLHFGRWDQAGIFVFAGFVAALTADSAEVMSFIETFAENSQFAADEPTERLE